MGCGVESVALELCGELGSRWGGGYSCAGGIGPPELVGHDLAALNRAGDLADAGDPPHTRYPAEVDDQIERVGYQEVRDIGDEPFRCHGGVHGESPEDSLGRVGVAGAHRSFVEIVRAYCRDSVLTFV